MDDGYKSDSQCLTTMSNYNHQENDEATSSPKGTSVVRNSQHNIALDGKDSDSINENGANKNTITKTHRIKTGKVVVVKPAHDDVLLLTVRYSQFSPLMTIYS